MDVCHRLVLSGVGLALVATTACATTSNGKPVSEQVGEHAAEGTLESTLDVLARPRSQAILGDLLGSPAIQDALRQSSASVVAGAFDGMGMTSGGGGAAPRTGVQPGPEVGGVEERLPLEHGRSRESKLAPSFDRSWSDDEDDAWAEPRSRPARLAASVGETVAAGMGSAIEDELGPSMAIVIEQQLGPALARVLEHDVLPAVGRGLQSEDVQQAIVRSMASMGVGVARGAERGLDESGVADEDGAGEALGRALAIGATVAIVAAALLAAALVVLIVMLVRTSRHQRRMFDTTRRREELLVELLAQRAESSVEQHPIITPPA
ncbi:hypothetical protein [Paraliomyxa miuraensis]|uniref:hypothetical protein n=1 Tax=Paraliomyxa miuraensis TaxID=376150 RepID=UPI00225032AE|nr:hypothetical protein [Paraliomyxa miuraensis]MCX4245476.1 hypothetical protein [Paraliomyxa miuraensis]